MAERWLYEAFKEIAAEPNSGFIIEEHPMPGSLARFTATPTPEHLEWMETHPPPKGFEATWDGINKRKPSKPCAECIRLKGHL